MRIQLLKDRHEEMEERSGQRGPFPAGREGEMGCSVEGQTNMGKLGRGQGGEAKGLRPPLWTTCEPAMGKLKKISV